jgi:hypothetical protein
VCFHWRKQHILGQKAGKHVVKWVRAIEWGHDFTLHTVYNDVLRRSFPKQPKLGTIQNKMFVSVVSLLDLKRKQSKTKDNFLPLNFLSVPPPAPPTKHKSVPEIIDQVFAKTSPKRSFSMTE